MTTETEMTIIQRTFGASVAVLPVIHVESVRQAAEEALLAFETGAHGVFLIQHDGNSRLALAASESACATLHSAGYDRPWVGINLLGLSPEEAYSYLHEHRGWDVRGVWSDTASDGIVRHADGTGVFASLYFASVAFKYQPEPANLAAAIRREVDHGADVITTSGPATGMACDPAKVRAIRAIVGTNGSVAVASGVTPKNARELVQAGANALLVATGIRKGESFHRMDAGKLKATLLEAAR